MCGIAGLTVNNELQANNSKAEIKMMVASLAHRGPDGNGTLIHGKTTLGHTRLSIIDIENGAQPMKSVDESLAITFNGEIYNYLDLKSILFAKGHHFATKSDTEVILAAYAEWGFNCTQYIRGMFAFAISDIRNNLLFLARDHFGIKPLVYTSFDDRLVFASEIQALRCLEWVNSKLTIYPQAIYEYLRFSYIEAPRTGFHQIRKLPPAHYLVFDLNNSNIDPVPVRYWQPNFNPDYTLSEAELQEKFEVTIRESIATHLVADVPIGGFLSGGLDSTLVVSYMANLLDHKIRTFTVGFEETTYDERSFAKIAADKLLTEHHEYIIRPDALALLPSLVKHYGEPFGDCSAVPTWYVSQLARSKVSTVLTGDGGDEFFAGYFRYHKWLNLSLRQHYDEKHTQAIKETDLLLGTASSVFNHHSLEYWASLSSFVDEPSLSYLWRYDCYPVIPYPKMMQEAYINSRSLELISQAQLIDIQTYMPFSILAKVDIASMMHGLECRTPLIDIRVAELALSIPPPLLVQNDDFSYRGKLPSRKYLKTQFPDFFIERKKQGFGIPLEEWLFSRKSYSLIQDILLDPNQPINQFLLPEGVKKLLQDKQGWPIWNLLFLNEWLNQL